VLWMTILIALVRPESATTDVVVRLKPDTTDVITQLKPDTTGIPLTDMADDSFPHNGSVRLQPDSPDSDRGKRTYMKVGCYQCHGREAQGASTGPRLGPDPLPWPQFARDVRSPRNEMPPYTMKVLSDEDLADVYAYVSSRPPAARGNGGYGGNGITQRNGATEKNRK
jgi:cytochrome c553